jgi:putative membrane protein
MRFLIRLVVTAAALAVAAFLVDGIYVSADGPARDTLTLVAVALVFGLINALVKPMVRRATGCLYVATLGVAALVVNALLFLVTGWLSGKLGIPFHVDGFWSAFWGAIIVGVVGWIISLALPDRKKE